MRWRKLLGSLRMLCYQLPPRNALTREKCRSYLLTQTTFLLLYGQALTVFDRKWTFIGAVFLFEVQNRIADH